MKNKTYATFKTSKGNIDMTKDCLARWLCLMEAFHIVEKKSETLGVNLEKKDWVKPLAFEKYVQQRFESMVLDMEIDERQGIFSDIKTEQESNLVVAAVS
jgi:hypothetical protein